jgi:hypothetical protein
MGAPFILFGVAAAGLIGLVTFLLWNALIPPILGLPVISFWQALGLLVLSRLLFGRLGWGRGMGHGRFARGWNNLTPEERERFRAAMQRGCPRSSGEGGAGEKV